MQRKQIGVRVVLFLVVMTGLTYAVKRKVWARRRALTRLIDRAPHDRSPVIGIIGGSGIYDIDGLEDKAWRQVETPWGTPSDALLFGRLGGVRCVFLPRHGRGHPLSPTHLNYRANIDALKRSGVTDVMSLSAVGSLKAELPPGHFVIVDQFIDRSFAREKSFFGEGIVAHVSMAHPVCSRLGDALEGAARGLGLPVTRGGTYLVMEGPQFSTKAESELYRSWGCSVIGMTNMPEAKLAREAELNYATVAMVTDFDCWHPDHDHVTVEAVVRVLLDNADKARALVQRVVPEIGQPRELCPAAATTRWTTRSSRRATCAIRSWWRSWTRWRDGCCEDEDDQCDGACVVWVAAVTSSGTDFSRPGTELHSTIRLRHGDRRHHDRAHAGLLHVKLFGNLGRQIYHAAVDVRPTILHFHSRRLAVAQIGHLRNCAEWQCLARGNVRIRVEAVAVGHLSVGEP